MVGAVVEAGGPGMDHDQAGAQFLGGPADPQIERRMLFLEIGPPDEHGLGGLQVGDEASVRRGGEELRVEPVVELGIDVVRPDGDPHELRQGVGVLVGEPRPTNGADGIRPSGFDDRLQLRGDQIERLRPRGLTELSIGAFHQRHTEPVRRVDVLEPEPALVAEPAVVGWFGVDTEESEHLVL